MRSCIDKANKGKKVHLQSFFLVISSAFYLGDVSLCGKGFHSQRLTEPTNISAILSSAVLNGSSTCNETTVQPCNRPFCRAVFCCFSGMKCLTLRCSWDRLVACHRTPMSANGKPSANWVLIRHLVNVVTAVTSTKPFPHRCSQKGQSRRVLHWFCIGIVAARTEKSHALSTLCSGPTTADRAPGPGVEPGAEEEDEEDDETVMSFMPRRVHWIMHWLDGERGVHW